MSVLVALLCRKRQKREEERREGGEEADGRKEGALIHCASARLPLLFFLFFVIPKYDTRSHGRKKEK